MKSVFTKHRQTVLTVVTITFNFLHVFEQFY